MKYNKNNLFGILSLFIVLICVVLYFQLDTQSTMETELKELQDEFIGQKKTLSTVVEMMQEERQEKAALKMRQDSLQIKISSLAAMKDSLAVVLTTRELSLYKQQKALYYANRKRKMLEKKLLDSTDAINRVSPVPAYERVPADTSSIRPPHN